MSITRDHHIDLDSDAPDWGVSAGQSEGDLLLSGRQLRTLSPAQLAVMWGLPTFNDCRRATALTDRVPNDQMASGTHVCVRTGDGHYAYVGITAVEAAGDFVTFDITVWGA